MYKPHTQSDRRRYVEEVELEPPIMFFLQGPGECGIPLRDALTGKYIRLVGRDDPMFRERGPSVSIRLKVTLSLLGARNWWLTPSDSIVAGLWELVPTGIISGTH